MGEQLKKDGQRIEVLDACGLDEAHQDLMVCDALIRAITGSDFAQDDVIDTYSACLGDTFVDAVTYLTPARWDKTTS